MILSATRYRRCIGDALAMCRVVRRRTAALVALAALALPILSGCQLLAARSDARYTVEMTDDNRFLPGTVDIPRGATVVWVNRGRFAHTSTAEPALAPSPDYASLPSGAEPWNSGEVNTGKQWAHTFDVPGTYVYFCQRHADDGMLGSITVAD